MSVLIKGMELPDGCVVCPFFIENHHDRGDDSLCRASGKEAKCGCPLVPVPEHGDLIDRDALMKILSKVIDINASIEQRNEATDQERRCLWWFEQQIGIAPTIIPADKEGQT